jgi:hypothetical protein
MFRLLLIILISISLVKISFEIETIQCYLKLADIDITNFFLSISDGVENHNVSIVLPSELNFTDITEQDLKNKGIYECDILLSNVTSVFLLYDNSAIPEVLKLYEMSNNPNVKSLFPLIRMIMANESSINIGEFFRAMYFAFTSTSRNYSTIQENVLVPINNISLSSIKNLPDAFDYLISKVFDTISFVNFTINIKNNVTVSYGTENMPNNLLVNRNIQRTDQELEFLNSTKMPIRVERPYTIFEAFSDTISQNIFGSYPFDQYGNRAWTFYDWLSGFYNMSMSSGDFLEKRFSILLKSVESQKQRLGGRNLFNIIGSTISAVIKSSIF